MKILGIIVLVLGIVMASFTGFDLITKKKVVDIGPLEVTADKKTPIYWSPITGGVLIVIGAALIIVDMKKK
jgi:hypothetical protein